MISASYALALGNRPFPNLLVHQILLFRLYLRKYLNNLVIHRQKCTFAKFKADFSCNFTNFDLESHSQTSVKVELVMFGLAFMKFRKLLTWIFLLFKSFHILQLVKSCFQKIDICKLLKIV